MAFISATGRYGYSSFQYELTPYLKYGNEKNVLAVRASVQQPCSRWYPGAGIYRHVRLTMTDSVQIAHWGTYVTTPDVSKNEATVRVETKIRNQSSSVQQVKLETVIMDATGREAVKAAPSERWNQTALLSSDQLQSFEAKIVVAGKSSTLQS